MYTININNEPHVKLKDVEGEIVKLKSENAKMRNLLTKCLDELQYIEVAVNLQNEIEEFLK